MMKPGEFLSLCEKMTALNSDIKLTTFNNSKMKRIKINIAVTAIAGMMLLLQSCKPKNAGNAVNSDAASKAYVAPGKYDEFYNFVSGGFSGQMSVYGLPSGRLLRVIPVFSQDPEKGYGYSEETKPMLNTSHGF